MTGIHASVNTLQHVNAPRWRQADARFQWGSLHWAAPGSASCMNGRDTCFASVERPEPNKRHRPGARPERRHGARYCAHPLRKRRPVERFRSHPGRGSLNASVGEVAVSVQSISPPRVRARSAVIAFNQFVVPRAVEVHERPWNGCPTNVTPRALARTFHGARILRTNSSRWLPTST